VTLSLQRSLQEFQRGLLVARLCHEAFEHPALVVNGPSLVVLLAIDLHEDLIKVPALAAESHPQNPWFSDLRSENWPKPIPPVPDRLMADLDTPLVKKVLYVAQGQRGPNVHHHR
jgi:hypothetical protein